MKKIKWSETIIEALEDIAICNIQIHSYNFKNLVNVFVYMYDIESELIVQDLINILKEHGSIVGDRYIILRNEFIENDCFWNLIDALMKLFNTNDDGVVNVICDNWRYEKFDTDMEILKSEM